VTRLIGTELFKLRKRLMTRVLLFVLIGLMVVIYMLLLAVSKVPLPAHAQDQINAQDIQNVLGLPTAIPFALSLLSSFGTVLAVILTASSMGSEYGWGTIRTFLICSESRLKFLGAKLIAAIMMILVGMVIGVAAGFVMSLITTAIGGYAFDFSFATGNFLWQQFVQFWRTFYVIMPYVLLGFLFAILGRSLMPGIAVGIGVFFLETIITVFMRAAGGWIARVPNYLLSANVDSITALNHLPAAFSQGPGGNAGQLPGVWHGAIVLLAYSLAFLMLGMFIFRRRDVTG